MAVFVNPKFKLSLKKFAAVSPTVVVIIFIIQKNMVTCGTLFNIFRPIGFTLSAFSETDKFFTKEHISFLKVIINVNQLKSNYLYEEIIR
jgi:hypothetical protein